jgi:hypothetical protein
VGKITSPKVGKFTSALTLNTCSLEPVWFIRVELSAFDDARVREAVADAVGLPYGSYDRVALESAEGTLFFRPTKGSRSGEVHETVETPARALTFSVPRDPETLAKAIEAIRYAHSYEEPVIYVMEGAATRADYEADRDNPNRWWNRGVDL